MSMLTDRTSLVEKKTLFLSLTIPCEVFTWAMIVEKPGVVDESVTLARPVPSVFADVLLRIPTDDRFVKETSIF
ncbi:MAG: hypothetical protein QW561_03565, partial [Candidatus Aenigmatarchaeota archaeon]